MDSVAVTPDAVPGLPENIKRYLYIAAVALYPVVFAGIIAGLIYLFTDMGDQGSVGAKTEFAEIGFPKKGSTVGSSFTSTGEIKKRPPNTKLFLVSRSDDLYWPKQPLGDAGSQWTRKFTAANGSGYKYSIVVLAVNPAGEKRILDWFAHGKETGKYPAIRGIKGAVELAAVRVVRE